MIIETIIFIGIFIGAIATGVISTWGWLKASNKNEELLAENKCLMDSVSAIRNEYARLKAENNFYKNQLEEK